MLEFLPHAKCSTCIIPPNLPHATISLVLLSHFIPEATNATVMCPPHRVRARCGLQTSDSIPLCLRSGSWEETMDDPRSPPGIFMKTVPRPSMKEMQGKFLPSLDLSHSTLLHGSLLGLFACGCLPLCRDGHPPDDSSCCKGGRGARGGRSGCRSSNSCDGRCFLCGHRASRALCASGMWTSDCSSGKWAPTVLPEL